MTIVNVINPEETCVTDYSNTCNACQSGYDDMDDKVCKNCLSSLGEQ